MSKSLWRGSYKDACIERWLKTRLDKAKAEYLGLVKGTPQELQNVFYKGQLFNPLGVVQRKLSTTIFEVPEKSEHALKLDRIVRVNSDIDTATRHLAYVLNYCDVKEEANFILGFSESSSSMGEERKKELLEFREANKGIFDALSVLEVLSKIV